MVVMAMNAAARQAAWAALTAPREEPELDVLVIGGGVTGAGIAVDAISRGLRVGIVEAQDWGAGTSSRSSKLVHGGLRYLQQLDIKLVTEALHERELLLHTVAPHLVRPVSFLYPLAKAWERPYVTSGVGMYDILARLGSRATMPFHRQHNAAAAQALFPDLKEGILAGAVQYWDSRVDDARLVLTLVRTASRYGALACSRVRVDRFVRAEPTTEGEPGRVVAAEVTDLETGATGAIRAKVFIAATGVWTEETQALADAAGGLKVLASKGIHITVPRSRIDGDVGLILQTEKSVLFVIPWERYWIIGTTDTPYEQSLTHPVASAADIDYVLDHANSVLRTPLTRADVIGVWAGLRPLLQPGTRGEGTPESTKVSREHTTTYAAPGLITIAGGKLTTYRVMAKDAVDLALPELGDAEWGKAHKSRSKRLPLLGAPGYYPLAAQADRLGREVGWDGVRVTRLLERYGDLVVDLIEWVRSNPDLGRPLAEAPAYLRVEIAYACTDEGALHLEDILCARTRMTYEEPRHGLAAVPEIADLAGLFLGWSEERKQAEISAYTARCAAEDAAANQPDDATAALARAQAPSVVG